MEFLIRIPIQRERCIKIQLFLFELGYSWLDSGQHVINLELNSYIKSNTQSKILVFDINLFNHKVYNFYDLNKIKNLTLYGKEDGINYFPKKLVYD